MAGFIIQMAQASSFSPVTRDGSAWSHAAIYVGNGMVVDATIGAGVTLQSVWTYCKTRAIQVRRLGHVRTAASTEETSDIAACALRHIGEPYSVLQAALSKLIPGTTPIADALYCSTLVGLVVAEATGVDLSSDPFHQPLHPGTLASHPDLDNVMLEWRHIRKTVFIAFLEE